MYGIQPPQYSAGTPLRIFSALNGDSQCAPPSSIQDKLVQVRGGAGQRGRWRGLYYFLFYSEIIRTNSPTAPTHRPPADI